MRKCENQELLSLKLSKNLLTWEAGLRVEHELREFRRGRCSSLVFVVWAGPQVMGRCVCVWL